MGWEDEKCIPDKHHVQLFIPGSRRGGEGAGGAGQRKEEQMRCGGRGGGPKAIVHVLRTKGSSGSVCKPTAGFSSLTRPHAGRNITDRLQRSRPICSQCCALRFFQLLFRGRIVFVRCLPRAYPFLRTERARVIITDL